MEHYDHLDPEGDKLLPQLPPLLAATTVPVTPLVDVASVSSSENLSSKMPTVPTSLAIPLVDVASVSSSETFSTSPTLTAFPRTSSPVLASDDSSPFDPYSYTYPYPPSRQNSEMQMQLPQLWSSTSLLAAETNQVLPLVDTASISSSDTLRASATLNAFSRSSSPILASPFDEKGRIRTTGLEIGGRRDMSTFLAISSGSSTSSSNEDDEDNYGPVNSFPSESQAVVLRTQHSRTTTSSSISTTSPGYVTPPLETLTVSHIESRFSESEDDDDDVDEDNEENDDDNDDDDDVPLAQRIPGALTAQKSIRSQVRQEREKKKQEKALRNHAETTRTRLMTLRPGAVPSSSHDTATTLVASETTVERISRSLTRNGSRSLNPFSRKDSLRRRGINGSDSVEAAATPVDATSLYQRLHSLHRSKSSTRTFRDVRPPSTEALPPVPIPPSSQTQRPKSVKEPSSLPYRFPTSPSPTPINSAYAPSSMTPLRPVRSFHFHRPSIDRRPFGMDDPSSVPLPSDAEKRISQNVTNITRSLPSTREGPQQTSTSPIATPTHHHHHHHRSLSRSRGSSGRTSPITAEPDVPLPPIPTTARISHGEYHKFHHCHLSFFASRVV